MRRTWQWILCDLLADNLRRLLLGRVTCVSAEPVLEGFKHRQIYPRELSNTVSGENTIKLTSPVLKKKNVHLGYFCAWLSLGL